MFIVPLSQLEQNEPRLLIAKSNRKTVEYYFTLTPWLLKASLSVVPQASRVTYLDSDLYFFNSPKPLWDEIGRASIVMVEHRFSSGYVDKQCYGRFNVGWNSFDRTPAAQKSLNWWAEACLEWCYDRVEGDKFADQGYLTTMYQNTDVVHVLKYPGINLAEYNLDNYDLSLSSNMPYANGLPVIYWHMHCLFELSDGNFKVFLREDLSANPVVNWAYQQYVNQIKSLNAGLQGLGIPIDRGNARYPELC